MTLWKHTLIALATACTVSVSHAAPVELDKVKVIIDEAAASELKNTKYYKEVFSKKPNWQTREFAV